MIVNELMSDSLQHAFGQDQGGEITIQMKEQEETYSLLLADSGAGFSDGFELRGTATVGSWLGNALVDRLKGTIRLDSPGGSQFNIEFPKCQH